VEAFKRDYHFSYPAIWHVMCVEFEVMSSMKRSTNIVVAALLATVALGVGYAAVGFASIFTCDASSDCFLATFFSQADGAASDAPSSSATLSSAPLPPEHESRVAGAPTPTPAPPSERPPDPPTASTAYVPASRSLAMPEVAAPLPSEVQHRDTAQATPANAETPVAAESSETDAGPKAPDASIVSGTIPPRVTSAATTEPEPGVLTDPPAGEVPDWQPIPDQSQGPILVAPVLILPSPARTPRVR
jgi:hypothetical protein